MKDNLKIQLASDQTKLMMIRTSCSGSHFELENRSDGHPEAEFPGK